MVERLRNIDGAQNIYTQNSLKILLTRFERSSKNAYRRTMDENIHSADRFYYLGGYRSNLVETRHITLPRRSGDNVQPEDAGAFQRESLCARPANTTCRTSNHSDLIR
jgi:hypothetical protein